MRLAWCGLILILGCNKQDGAPKAGNGEPVSAAAPARGPVAAAAGAAMGPAAAGAAVAGSDAASAAAAAAALDEIDRWLAPVSKLSIRAQMDFLCAVVEPLRPKLDALSAMAPPAGVDPAAWRSAEENLHGQIDGVGLCCNSYGFYETPPKPHGDDDFYLDCLKAYPDAFAGVAKLVPGAKPLRVHAGDPLMTLPKK